MSAARELMKTCTYEQLNIDAICKKAGVSTGAFYHHFKSKQGLIIVGYEQCDRYFNEYVIKNLQKRDPIERIVEYIDYQMVYALEIGIDFMIQLYKAQITDGASFFLQSTRGLPNGLRILVEEAQKSGLLVKTQSAEEIASELLLVSRGVIYNWCQNEGNYELRSFCNKIITHHLNGFLQSQS